MDPTLCSASSASLRARSGAVEATATGMVEGATLAQIGASSEG